jgi:hypothetical protein
MLRATRRALITLGLLGVLCRALVPVGLMPAPVSAGGPLVFCYDGAAGAFFRALAAEGDSHHGVHGGAHALHGHAYSAHTTHAAPSAALGHDPGPSAPLDLDPDDAADEHLAWEHCSFGTAFAHAAIAPIFDVPLLALEHARALPVPRTHSTTTSARPYWARGPPPQTV